MQSEIYRIVDRYGNQMSSRGYPNPHVFLNETKCKKAVDALNAGGFNVNSYSGLPPFRMQSCTPVWEDRNGSN